MCTWFYAESSTLSPIITKAQQLPLADTIRNSMSRSAEMSGNIRPTDIAAVFAPNKQGLVRIYDSYSQELVFMDKSRINIHAISRYVYSALQGGSIMRNWTNDDRMMIACCNDGTRPVIFKIERIDIPETDEEKEWLSKQDFKNSADDAYTG